MYVNFNEITLEDLLYITNAIIDGDRKLVFIGVEQWLKALEWNTI